MFLLEQCGVIHMHENRKLIGASRAEDHMTRCAIQDVYELHQFSQQAAANCDPYTEVSGCQDRGSLIRVILESIRIRCNMRGWVHVLWITTVGSFLKLAIPRLQLILIVVLF